MTMVAPMLLMDPTSISSVLRGKTGVPETLVQVVSAPTEPRCDEQCELADMPLRELLA